MELLALLQIVVQERQQEQMQHLQHHSRRLEREHKRLEGQADAGRTMLLGGYIQPKGKPSPVVINASNWRGRQVLGAPCYISAWQVQELTNDRCS